MIQHPNFKDREIIDRYPGIRPFRREEDFLFFGRDKEITELVNTLKIHEVFLLFGKSGVGKTSLLNAGLIPRLIQEKMIPIRIRFLNSHIHPLTQITSAIKDARPEESIEDTAEGLQDDISELLNKWPPESVAVLIFDQFEEFFYYHEQLRKETISKIVDLLNTTVSQLGILDLQGYQNATPNHRSQPIFFVKLLFIIRSDKLSYLEELSFGLPNIFNHRYELKSLTIEQAEQAIVSPARLHASEGLSFRSRPFLYSAEALKNLAQTLSNPKGQLDCFQLQLVCMEMEKIATDKSRKNDDDIVIEPSDYGGNEGLRNILGKFYESQLRKLLSNEKLALQTADIEVIRRLIEDELLVGTKRISLHAQKVRSFLSLTKPDTSLIDHIKKEEIVIEELMNLRLIREEETQLGKVYEITHDALVPSIIMARNQRMRGEKAGEQYSLRLIEENKRTKNESLDLSNCGLIEIPVQVTQLEWLQELVISGGTYLDYKSNQTVYTINKGEPNYITILPKDIGRLKGLKKLVITGTPTRVLGLSDLSGIEHLSGLTDLYISYTMVRDIHPLTSLPNLRIFDLSNTQVIELNALSSSKNLETLLCINTKVHDLSPLANLKNLKVLLIEMTTVYDVPVLANHRNLKKLSLARTSQENIASISMLTELIYLDLSFNAIHDIQPLADLSQLQILYLNNTQLSSLGALSQLKSLERLFVFNTEVSDLSPLAMISGLKRIDFSNTSVKDITVLEALQGLQHLNFDKCHVSILHPITKLGSLESFSCKGNPITDCPVDVYETGDIKQVRAYFQAKEFENISMASEDNVVVLPTAKYKKKHELENTRRDIKLIILGNSNSGKTNLVTYLESGKFTGTRNTTHGLEVHRWIPDEKRFPQLKDIAVSIWDFGGQEYYHNAYRLFLSDNALYLLLWCNDSNMNGRTKTCLRDQEEPVDLENFELRYWFDTIRHYSGGDEKTEMPSTATNADQKSFSSQQKIKARLITLQNKVDNPDSEKKRIAQELHEKYSISDSFHISLLKGSSIENPRQYRTLENFLSELEFALQDSADKDSIPAKWQLIRNKILSLKHQTEDNPFLNDLWIRLDDFRNSCNSFLQDPLTEDELYTIPRWLEKGGTVVFFPEIQNLSDKVFLRPDLLAEKIYQVLNEKVRLVGGEFSVGEIFDKKEQELREVFIELAQHLELIFPHPVRPNEFLAPQYLPETHPIEDLFKIASYGAWQSDLWIKVPLFYYRKILHGILIQYAADTFTDCRYFWKHGIMFIKNGLRVLIKGLYPEHHQLDGVILIGVEKDPQKQNMLHHEIFNKLREIMKQRGKTGKVLTPTASDSDTNVLSQMKSMDTNMTGIDTDIQVSYDGENYIVYKTLLENAAEPKVKATNTNTLLMTYNFAAILPSPPQRAKKVFLSYSHQNTGWLNRLRTHLAGLRRAKQIETWDDREILPGDMWDTAIKKRIEEADVFILLLSADFIASEYIWNDELPKAFEKLKTRNAVVIPILFEPLDLGGLSAVTEGSSSQTYKINDFEIIPKTLQGHLKAVSLWENQEEALAIIAQRIREAIKK